MTDSQTASRRPDYLGDPTIARVATRPRWIAALALALIVAAGFAWLGRWQLDNAIRSDTFDSAEFESPRPLSELAKPGAPVTEAAAGAVVTTRGAVRGDDLQVVAPRENGGELGAWVVGHLVVPHTSATGSDGAQPDAGHLAVAIGWAPSVSVADAAIGTLAESTALESERAIEGRFMPTEGPVIPAPEEDPSLIKSLVPAYLVNLWSGVEGPAYSGYLVLHPTGETEALLETAGLTPIDSVAPEPPEAVSWLNVFYAVEWVVFAGFAVFLWYRLVRDAWEKEHELMLLKAEQNTEGRDVELAERSDREE